MQIVFCSIITLIAINYSFFLHSRWYLEVLCGNVKFLSDSQKYNRDWLVICSNCRYQYGLTNLVQLSLHLPCLYVSSLIFSLQDWKVKHVEISVANKRFLAGRSMSWRSEGHFEPLRWSRKDAYFYFQKVLKLVKIKVDLFYISHL